MTESTEQLQSYEELFAHRFSSDDHEYQQYVRRPADTPPVVEDWRGHGGGNQRGRGNRYQDRRGHGGHGGGGGWGAQDRGWRGDHRGQHWQDRERHRAHGSGHVSRPPSSNQGQHFYQQRPYSDRY